MILVPVLTPEASAISNTPELRHAGEGRRVLPVSAEKSHMAGRTCIERKLECAPGHHTSARDSGRWGWGAGLPAPEHSLSVSHSPEVAR